MSKTNVSKKLNKWLLGIFCIFFKPSKGTNSKCLNDFPVAKPTSYALRNDFRLGHPVTKSKNSNLRTVSCLGVKLLNDSLALFWDTLDEALSISMSSLKVKFTWPQRVLIFFTCDGYLCASNIVSMHVLWSIFLCRQRSFYAYKETPDKPTWGPFQQPLNQTAGWQDDDLFIFSMTPLVNKIAFLVTFLFHWVSACTMEALQGGIHINFVLHLNKLPKHTALPGDSTYFSTNPMLGWWYAIMYIYIILSFHDNVYNLQC